MQGRQSQCAPATAREVTRTWRTQRISFEFAGLGRFSVTADPRSVAPDSVGPETGDLASPERVEGIGTDVSRVIATERARDAVELPGEIVIIPALGPVIPTEASTVPTITELDDGSILAIDAPDSADGIAPALPELPGDPDVPAARPAVPQVRRDDRKWLRSQQVLECVWREGVVTGSGALVGADRTWFEPAIAVMRADGTSTDEDPAGGNAACGADGERDGGIDLLELALDAAKDCGQVAVMHVHDGRLDVIPTGLDPRVPHLRDQPSRATVSPGMCPVTGADTPLPCRAEGGPDGEDGIRARLAFDARRSLAVALLGCGVCHGRGRSDDGRGHEVDVPLPLALSLGQIPRITLRAGETIEIDALQDLYAAEEPF